MPALQDIQTTPELLAKTRNTLPPFGWKRVQMGLEYWALYADGSASPLMVELTPADEPWRGLGAWWSAESGWSGDALSWQTGAERPLRELRAAGYVASGRNATKRGASSWFWDLERKPSGGDMTALVTLIAAAVTGGVAAAYSGAAAGAAEGALTAGEIAAAEGGAIAAGTEIAAAETLQLGAIANTGAVEATIGAGAFDTFGSLGTGLVSGGVDAASYAAATGGLASGAIAPAAAGGLSAAVSAAAPTVLGQVAGALKGGLGALVSKGVAALTGGSPSSSSPAPSSQPGQDEDLSAVLLIAGLVVAAMVIR